MGAAAAEAGTGTLREAATEVRSPPTAGSTEARKAGTVRRTAGAHSKAAAGTAAAAAGAAAGAEEDEAEATSEDEAGRGTISAATAAAAAGGTNARGTISGRIKIS